MGWLRRSINLSSIYTVSNFYNLFPGKLPLFKPCASLILAGGLLSIYLSLFFTLLFLLYFFYPKVFATDPSTVTCMWGSRLRATFLSNRDEIDAGDEPIIIHKPGYDIYRLLAFRCFIFIHISHI
jgi:hypothetical protein